MTKATTQPKKLVLFWPQSMSPKQHANTPSQWRQKPNWVETNNICLLSSLLVDIISQLDTISFPLEPPLRIWIDQQIGHEVKTSLSTIKLVRYHIWFSKDHVQSCHIILIHLWTFYLKNDFSLTFCWTWCRSQCYVVLFLWFFYEMHTSLVVNLWILVIFKAYKAGSKSHKVIHFSFWKSAYSDCPN